MFKPSPHTFNDTETWNKFQKGSKEAYTLIYNYFIDDLLRYGYRITSDRQLIKDSIQDLFLHLWYSKENLSETDSIKFYLYRSLRNQIVKNIAAQDKTPIDSNGLLEDIIGRLAIEEDSWYSEEESEQLYKLKRAMLQLSKRQQEVIQLRYYHDFSFSEISEILQINQQSVRNLLHRTITELRHFLYLFWTIVMVE